jgi:uncharacterized membrane protein
MAPMAEAEEAVDAAQRATRSLVITGLMLGVGLMAALDTVLFHQILQWHNFYAHTNDHWRIVSDGLLHFATTTLLFLGALRLWDDRAVLRGTEQGRAFAGVIVLGMGAFQLFDGTIDHLLLQLHPVRENVSPIWPYDLAWNAAALLMIVVGWLLWRSGRPAVLPRAEADRAPGHGPRRAEA